MNDFVLVVEIILAASAVLLLVAVLATFLRRRAIAQGQQLILCGMRGSRDARWRSGMLRPGSTRLDWFTLFGLSLRPAESWDRSGLDFGTPKELTRGSGMDTLVPAGLVVPCTSGPSVFELAVARAPYTALRSWLEASPPGRHVDIA